jgi:hypothetical protein
MSTLGRKVNQLINKESALQGLPPKWCETVTYGKAKVQWRITGHLKLITDQFVTGSSTGICSLSWWCFILSALWLEG